MGKITQQELSAQLISKLQLHKMTDDNGNAFLLDGSRVTISLDALLDTTSVIIPVGQFSGGPTGIGDSPYIRLNVASAMALNGEKLVVQTLFSAESSGGETTPGGLVLPKPKQFFRIRSFSSDLNQYTFSGWEQILSGAETLTAIQDAIAGLDGKYLSLTKTTEQQVRGALKVGGLGTTGKLQVSNEDSNKVGRSLQIAPISDGNQFGIDILNRTSSSGSQSTDGGFRVQSQSQSGETGGRLLDTSGRAYSKEYEVDALFKKYFSRASGTTDNQPSIVLYVTTSGNDSTGTGASNAPFRTIQKAVTSVPMFFPGDVTINVGTGTYNEDVVVGPRSLAASFALLGNTSNPAAVKVRTIKYSGIIGYCDVRGFEFTNNRAETFPQTLTFSRCGYGAVRNCRFMGEMRVGGETYNAAITYDNSNGYVDTTNYFKTQFRVVYSKFSSQIGLASGIEGANNINGACTNRGIIQKVSLSGKPGFGLGAATPEVISAGGLITATGDINFGD